MAIPAFSAGQFPTASAMNTALNSPFPVGIDAFTSYVPTLTQSATVTKTVEYAGYMKIGRLVVANVSLSVTGTGTAANAILIGLPPFAPVAFRNIGSGGVYDASANLWYGSVANWVSSTTFNIQPSGFAGALGVSSMAAALASGDIVTACLSYWSST